MAGFSIEGLSRSRQLPIWTYLGIYTLLAAIALYPLMIVEIPNLVDYPNHLARMYILSHDQSSAALQRFYEVTWRPIPYIGMDASFLILTQFTNIYTAGRIFVGLCVLMPVLSTAVLHFALYRRLSLVPTSAFLLCYNGVLLWGFLNYLPVLCLSVMVFAGWIATVTWPNWRRVLVFAPLALILYLGHLVAFGAYCLLVGSYEVVRLQNKELRAWRRILADWTCAAGQTLPTIILLLQTRVERPFVGPLETEYGNITVKMIALLSPILFLVNRMEIFIGCFFLVVLIIGRITDRIRISKAFLQIFIIVGLVSICFPMRLFDVFGMDFRLPLLAAIVLIAGLETTERSESRFRYAVILAIIVATAIRSAAISTELKSADSQISTLRKIIAEMPRGMRMLTIDTSTGARHLENNSMNITEHAPLLAIIDRDAFVPTLFTGLGTVKPTYELRASSTQNGFPYPTLDQFVDGYNNITNSTEDIPSGIGGRVYWLGWERKFDYVLVMHYGNRPRTLPKILRLVASSEVADLYAIAGR